MSYAPFRGYGGGGRGEDQLGERREGGAGGAGQRLGPGRQLKWKERGGLEKAQGWEQWGRRRLEDRGK